MNCSDVRDRLTDWLYDELPGEDRARLEQHLAGCPRCRRDADSVRHVCRLLDRVPAPVVHVDLPRLYRDAAERHQGQARRWRRGALALLGAAAVLLLVLGLRLEVRVEAHQAILRWGTPPDREVPIPEPAPPPPVVPVANEPLIAGTTEQLLLNRELIHALAADVEAKDRSRQEELVRLQELCRRTNNQLADMERHLAAVQAAYLILVQKGEK